MRGATKTLSELDLGRITVREVNRGLREAPAGSRIRVLNPAGKHNLAVGLEHEVEVDIEGAVGYYAAGMNKSAVVQIAGNGGVGIAENMMSGRVDVGGSTAAAAAASAHGGLLVVRGDAGGRCGISLKGGDVIIGGSAGHACGFMAQSGRIVICGDAGEALGDSIYEARIYVRGNVTSLGADCVEKPIEAEHLAELGGLLATAGIEGAAGSFRRYGSARNLYHFGHPTEEGST